MIQSVEEKNKKNIANNWFLQKKFVPQYNSLKTEIFLRHPLYVGQASFCTYVLIFRS